MRYGILIVFIIALLGSCSNKKRVPRGVLPQQKMKEVMWDMLKADEFVKGFIASDSSKNVLQESLKLYDQVFAIHKTSREQFQKSLKFYESRPDLLVVVMDSLNRMGSRAEQEIYKPRPLRDTSSPKKILKGFDRK